jgi:hypothetical protein
MKELLPSKYAKLPEDFEQESNLDYVLRTRAKKELIYISDFDKINNVKQNDNPK